MDRTESPGGPGHETSDVSVRAIVRFGIGLAASAVLISVAMWGLFRFLEKREEKKDRPLPPLAAQGLKRTPPEPRLEPDPLAPRRRVRAREDAVLTSYGWVDKSAGVARIPIDRAMDLLVEKGLPPARIATPPPTQPVRKTGKTAHEIGAGLP